MTRVGIGVAILDMASLLITDKTTQRVSIACNRRPATYPSFLNFDIRYSCKTASVSTSGFISFKHSAFLN